MQFSHLIDDAVLPNVTAARHAHNNTALPPEGSAPGTPPQTFETNDAFLRFRMDEDIRGMVRKYGLLPPDPNAVPEVVTRKQGLKALARATEPDVGMAAPVYEADIEALIAGMPSTTPEEQLQKYDFGLEFRTAPTWRRGNPFFETLRQALGITEVQRDALLKKAATFQE